MSGASPASTSMAPPPTSASMTPPPTSTPMTPPPNSVVVKPVIVRVKRKASQARIDGFWLEINEKPLKKPFLDLESLSISDSDTKKEVLATKKMLVHHLETVGQSQSIKDALHSVLQQSSNNTQEEFKRRSKERRSLLKADKKHDQLLSVARKEHEDLARSARFEQIWKRRRSIDVEESSLREVYHLYDVVQVDAEDETRRKQKPIHAPDGDAAVLHNYLPLIREFLPEAAEEIEHEIETTEDNFVYDLYTVGYNMGTGTDTSEYPLVQVDDDECYDDPLQSDYESDDSNAEDNPRNDYPDEESSEDVENEDPFIDLEDSNSDYEQEEIYREEEDGENWRWEYR
ncbi:RNA-directed DNA methylation 4-like isoform X1 [Zingiber officinale]|uniref:RNA-directed DNA methylation 4-like isoform X1 n=1 Tax=Zingiber officinale TaxID=94328 RepID=UPI001C4D7DD6|nr:RNA-directed DNA methylation 4-like isoform X1 [Zingiber officinale]